jgi:two-component system cell cycle response regulator DivK
VERRTFPADRRAAPRGGRRRVDHTGRPVVLIVDDHVDSRDLLATILQELGVTISEAGTGAEAFGRLGTTPLPSLILIDLALPDCHGSDIVRALKADAATRDIPVVALSAAVTTQEKARATNAGCVAFIEKPLLPDNVIALVRRVLSAR